MFHSQSTKRMQSVTSTSEPEPSVTDEPSPSGATELRIAQEPEPILSNQVREPATEPATVHVPDGHEGAEDSTAHCTTAEGEQCLDLGLLALEQDLTDFFGDVDEDMPALLPPSSKLPDYLDFPPTLPLLSPSIVSAASVPPPLSPGSPSTICAVGSLQSSVAPALPWTSASTSALVARALGSALALRILGVAQDHRLSVSASGSTSTCSAAVSRPPGVVSPSSTMAPPSVGSTVGYHNGCSLGLTWLLLLRVPSVSFLAPPSV
ncbi:hypothetical protein H4Q32_014108 [Labeo rohita]|uniref:Uncharacterized protein n=1 Tax=Labeo rohita TaxID=84645 RepID=A0ABQ8LSZ4_LABRO|nr:hypothetical protein H4Q32_014108 [Labeo rohita]